jgi:tetratricopeptide (TPR) repeat protein
VASASAAGGFGRAPSENPGGSRTAAADKRLVKSIIGGPDALRELAGELRNELEGDPGSAVTWLYLARVLDNLDDAAEAANVFRHVHRLTPRDSPLWDALLVEIAQFALRRGDEGLRQLIADGARNGTQVPPQSPPGSPGADAPPDPPPGRRRSGPAARRSSTSDAQLAEAVGLFDRGELTDALARFESLHAAGLRRRALYLKYAETLARSGSVAEAVQLIDEGLEALDGKEAPALLTLKAQLLSRSRRYEEAARVFETLIKQDRRPGAWRNNALSLARIYQRQGRPDDARALVDRMLRQEPEYLPAQRLANQLASAVQEPGVEPVAEPEERALVELGVEIPEDLASGRSPMLSQDVRRASYRDEQILRRGSPLPEDAARLFAEAAEIRDREFAERYPLFLEAAKAFSDLPAGSFEEAKLDQALARYAAMRGGALTNEVLRRLSRPPVDLVALGRLHDSAISYYRESLVMSAEKVSWYYLRVSLTRYLLLGILNALCEGGHDVPQKLERAGLERLLGFGLEHSDDRVVAVVLESLVAWGAARTAIWKPIWDGGKSGGAHKQFAAFLQQPGGRERITRVLAQVEPLEPARPGSREPGSLISRAIKRRRAAQEDMERRFQDLQRLRLDADAIDAVVEAWSEIPAHRGVLLRTDLEVLWPRVTELLTGLRQYRQRTPEERSAVLFEARTRIEQLQREIDAYPTYWGRTGLQPLLERWLQGIHRIEERRFTEIRPELAVELDPPVLHRDGNLLRGTLRVSNRGRAAADTVELTLELDGSPKTRFSRSLGTLAVDATTPVEFDVQGAAGRPSAGGELVVNAVAAYRGTRGVPVRARFTVELASPLAFEDADIPWSEDAMPAQDMFKGRERLLADLRRRILGRDRTKTQILFGLTRTGKSSILLYLGKALDLAPIRLNDQELRVVTFSANLATAAGESNAADMWRFLLGDRVIARLDELAGRGTIPHSSVPSPPRNDQYRFKDWQRIISHLRGAGLYPVFLFDEFSFYTELVRKKRIDTSFLAAIREFALGSNATFVFAGTYDIRNMIRDPTYGITGQLVNTQVEHVSRIEPGPARELVRAMEPKLRFTDAAVTHILRLSNQLPYFIQMLCRHCAVFALAAGRSLLGFPEVELVVGALTGEIDRASHPLLTEIPELSSGVFMNNMYSESDPVEYRVLLSTLSHLLSDPETRSRFVTQHAIMDLLQRSGITMLAGLAAAIRELVERQVLIQTQDEGDTAFAFSVDLFRRWWYRQYAASLDLELAQLPDAIRRRGR